MTFVDVPFFLFFLSSSGMLASYHGSHYAGGFNQSRDENIMALAVTISKTAASHPIIKK